jgi:tetratricopeptide (TPR) repeat protein
LRSSSRSSEVRSTHRDGAPASRGGSATPAIAPRPAGRFLSSPWAATLLLGLLIAASFAEGIFKPIFGSEYPAFVSLNSSRDLGAVLRSYTDLGYFFYRPTAFYAMFWIGSRFLEWHNLAGWKIYQLLTLCASVGVFYWLFLKIFPDRRRAALMACAWYATHPVLQLVVIPLHQFEFVHVFFVLLAAGLYWNARQAQGRRAALLSLAVGFSFLAALTGKEMAIALPGALVLIALFAPDGLLPTGALKKGYTAELGNRIRREALLMTPCFVILLAYWWFHIRHIPGRSDYYRTAMSLGWILENARKYPLFVARIFRFTGDTQSQAVGLMALWHSFPGFAVAALVVWKWIGLVRSSEVWRWRFWLALGWMVVFMVVPIYSGAYIWHPHLAFFGYSMLAGVAIWHAIDHDGPRIWTRLAPFAPATLGRPAAAAFVLLVLGACGIWQQHLMIVDGIYSPSYRVARNVLEHPPAPPPLVTDFALVYAEDRVGNGQWLYGGDNLLFALVYQKPKLVQRSVPAMEDVPVDQRFDWLAHPNSFFFTLSGENWIDRSEPFRRDTALRIGAPVGKLFGDGRANQVAHILDRVADVASPSDYYFQYHYALGLEFAGRYAEALDRFNAAVRLDPKATLAFFNRGDVYQRMGDLPRACADWHRSLALDPRYANAQRQIASNCR